MAKIVKSISLITTESTKLYFSKKAIKNVEILYAVKSNSDKEILKTIYENNIGFDIASEEEFNLLKFNTSSISITGPDFNNLFIKKCLDSNISFDFNSKIQLVNFFREYAHCFNKIGVRLNVNGSRFGFVEDDFSFLEKFVINRIHVHYGNKDIQNTKEVLKYLTYCIFNYKVFSNIDSINLGGGIENIYINQSKYEFFDILENFRVNISKKLNRDIRLILEPGDLISGFIGFVNPRIIEYNKDFIIINISRLNFSPWKDIRLVYPERKIGRTFNIFGNSCFEGDYFCDSKIFDYDKNLVLFPVSSYNFNVKRTIHNRKSPNIIYYRCGKFYE